MEFEPNHIDDIFRQRLYDTETPPPPFVWSNVERALQKRKRRRFFLWLFAFGVASAGVWAMYIRHRVSSPANVVQQQVFLENKSETTATVPGVHSPVEIQNPESASNAAGAASYGTSVDLKVTENRSAKGGELWFEAPGQVEGVTLNQTVTPTDAFAQPDPANATHSEFTGFLPLELYEPEPLVFSRKNDFPKTKTFIRKKKDPKYCYDFAQNPNVWMLDAYAGPTFSNRSLEAGAPSYDAYAQMRSATEQPDWAFNAGLRGSLLLSRHFLIRTGLHYEQMTEEFEYADPNYVKYIVEIINQPGEPTIIDTVGVEYGENYIKTYNRFGMLDIPLELGAELRSGRFGLSLNAGFSFNVLFWKRGTILSPDTVPTPFTPGEDDAVAVFRTRTGLSAGGSAQLFFHLNPTVRVFTEPYYRKILKPVTLDDQPVEQRYSNWGVKIGMTKILD